MKKFLPYLALTVIGALVVYADIAGETPIVDRTPSGILSTGGTTSENGHTVMVTYNSGGTNEFSIESVTATVSGAVTASTNTFDSAYLATPIAIKGIVSGSAAGVGNNSVVTVSTTTLIVTGLSTNASIGTNNVPVIIYGYKRAGKFQ